MKAERDDNILAQATTLMVAGIIVRIIGILYRSPVTGIIGDEGNGYYGFAYNIYTVLLLISSYSIPQAVSKVVSEKLALKEYQNAHRVFRCALLYVVLVGGAAGLLTFFAAPYLIAGSQQNAIPALRVLAPAIFLSGILGVLRGYFQAHNNMMPTSLSQIIEQLLNAVVSIAGAYFFISVFAGGKADKVPVYGAAGSALGTVAGVAAGLIFMLLVYRSNQSFFAKRRERDTSGAESSYSEIFRNIFRIVTPMILSTCVYNISTIIDQNIFVHIMDGKGMASTVSAELYGVFSTKYTTMINIPVALANSLSLAMIPAVSYSFALRDYKKCNGQIKEVTKFTMLISIPAAIGICVLACPLMQILFPQKATIRLAIRLLRCGCVSVIFYSLSTVTNGVLQGIGKVNVPLKNALFALILHVLVLVPLLYATDWKLYAMVAATITYSFLMCLFNQIAVRKYLGYRQEFRRSFGIPFLSALIMGVFCYVFYQGAYFIAVGLFGSLLPLRLLICLCVIPAVLFAVFVYFAAVLRLGGVDEEELRAFPKGGLLVRAAKHFRLFP